MPFRAVLFDLDGTLLDTLEDIADSMNRTLEERGLPQHPVPDYKRYVGDGVEMLVRRVLPADRIEPAFVAECGSAMRAEYAERWSRKTHPYPGIPDLLDALVARRMPFAVLSNKPDDFTRLCIDHFFSRWKFAAVIGMQPGLPRKPDPAGALEIARRLAVAPEDMLYLGDTNTDMQTATSAGMYPVGALWGFRTAEELLANGARQLIGEPMELVGVLEKGGAWSSK